MLVRVKTVHLKTVLPQRQQNNFFSFPQYLDMFEIEQTKYVEALME